MTHLIDLGKDLQERRLKRGLSLAEISEQTRINVRIIQSLEEGDIKPIPGKFFFYQYIRSILREIGDDPDEFIKKHNEQIVAETEPLPVTDKRTFQELKYAKFRKSRRWLILIMLVAILFSAVSYFLNRSDIPDLFGWVDKLTSQPLSLPVSGFRKPAPELKWNFDYSPVQLNMVAETECWIRIIRGTEMLQERILAAGENLAVNGYNFTLWIGRPDQLQLYLNGKEVKYHRTEINPLRIAITHLNVAELLDR